MGRGSHWRIVALTGTLSLVFTSGTDLTNVSADPEARLKTVRELAGAGKMQVRDAAGEPVRLAQQQEFNKVDRPSPGRRRDP